jgi:rhomboid protease GluP
VIYLVAGIGGSATSYVFIDPRSIGVGASGAVFGVLGAIAAYYYLNQHIYGKYGRGMMMGIGVIVLLNLGFGFTVEGVDNWAHMGGLLFGLLGAIALQKHKPKIRFGILGSYFSRVLVVGIILVVVLVFMAKDNPVNNLSKAQSLFEEQKYELSIKEIEKIIGNNPDWGHAYLLRGKILSAYINKTAGKDDLIKAVRLGDKSTRTEAIKLLSTDNW